MPPGSACILVSSPPAVRHRPAVAAAADIKTMLNLKHQNRPSAIRGRPAAQPASRLGIDRSGQAMVELAVGLVIIMVLIGGLIQIGRLSNAHTRTMIQARAMAARAALAATQPQPAGRYIYSWIAGPDGQPYTRDDIPVLATNAPEAPRAIDLAAQPQQLAGFVPGNAPASWLARPQQIDEFYLVQGHNQEVCPTLSIIRALIADQEAINVESEAWLVWTKGLY